MILFRAILMKLLFVSFVFLLLYNTYYFYSTLMFNWTFSTFVKEIIDGFPSHYKNTCLLWVYLFGDKNSWLSLTTKEKFVMRKAIKLFLYFICHLFGCLESRLSNTLLVFVNIKYMKAVIFKIWKCMHVHFNGWVFFFDHRLIFIFSDRSIILIYCKNLK